MKIEKSALDRCFEQHSETILKILNRGDTVELKNERGNVKIIEIKRKVSMKEDKK